MTHFEAAHFLTMTKLSSGVRPITMREALYQLISRILCLNFVKLLQHIFPYSNLELQLKVIIKQ
jgi:hypothetical protein